MRKRQIYSGTSLAKVLHYYGLPTDEEKIVCPFHSDVNPSMKVDYESGTCYCFGCSKRFTVLDFVKEAEGIYDDMDAAIRLAHILKSNKVRKIKAKSATKTRADKKQSLVEASDYFNCLSKTDWSKESGDVLNYMLKRGFDVQTLNKAQAKLNINEGYPIIFPILDNNEFKGWVCRTTTTYIENKRKYLYNEGFSRATTLCGTYKEGKTLVICEGLIDKLKLNKFGLKNVVAILGWKITAEQIEKLKQKHITTIISALDNDTCGQKGTQYLGKFFKVIPFCYPKGVKDAGDLTLEQFKKAYKRTKTIYMEDKKNGSSR